MTTHKCKRREIGKDHIDHYCECGEAYGFAIATFIKLAAHCDDDDVAEEAYRALMEIYGSSYKVDQVLKESQDKEESADCRHCETPLTIDAEGDFCNRRCANEYAKEEYAERIGDERRDEGWND